MIITICGSMQFFEKIELLREELENRGFKVFTPSIEWTVTDYATLTSQGQADHKGYFIDNHIEKIKKSDAVLIANFSKNEITNYIWANSFLEMGFAYILEKKIFILNEIPNQPNSTEILWLKPLILKANLDMIS